MVETSRSKDDTPGFVVLFMIVTLALSILLSGLQLVCITDETNNGDTIIK